MKNSINKEDGLSSSLGNDSQSPQSEDAGEVIESKNKKTLSRDLLHFYKMNNPFYGRGRLGRLDFLFWSWGFPVLLLMLLFGFLMTFVWVAQVLHISDQSLILLQIAAIPILILFPIALWIKLMAYVKRLHDFNISGWWLPLCIVLSIIPGINLIVELVFLITPGTNNKNKYGLSYQTPKWERKTLLVSAIIIILIFVLLISAGLRSFNEYQINVMQYKTNIENTGASVSTIGNRSH